MRRGLQIVGMVSFCLLAGSCTSLMTTRLEDPAGICRGDRFSLLQDVMLTRRFDLVPWPPEDVQAFRRGEPEWRERRKRYEGVLEAGTTIEYRKAIAIPDINTGAVVQHLGRVLPPSPWAGKTVMLDAVLFPDGHGRPYSTNSVAKLTGRAKLE